MIKYFREHELRRMFQAIKQRQHKALFVLMYNHGLRVSEASVLKVSDLNFSVKPPTIHITRVKKKNNRDQEHPLNEEESALLRKWLRKRNKHRAVERGSDYLFLSNKSRTMEDHLSPEQIQHIFKRYTKQLGIDAKGKNVHSLRHSCGARLAAKGRNAFAIQSWLGHSSVISSQRYVELFGPEKAVQDAENLEALRL